jgi:hypothetical protein
MTLLGYRESRYKDFVIVVNLIRDDNLSFDKIISYIISFDLLPKIMLTFARDENIQDASTKRVIVNMNVQDKVIEVVEELSLRHLRKATKKRKNAISIKNLFREIDFEGITFLLN